MACFRLLLGRAPSPEERAGHLLQVGRPLAEVVAAYLGAQEFRQRRLVAPDAGALGPYRTPAGFLLHADPADAAVGATVAGRGPYEPHVAAVLEARLRPGRHVVDIGANIGWFTMLFALRVGPEGHVLAVEPSVANARLLEASRRANGFGNITLLPVAASDDNGALALGRVYSNGTTSTLDSVDALDAEIVPSLRLDDVLARRSHPIDLVKIDVEGHEALALGGMARTLAEDRPVIVSEFAPDMMRGRSAMSGRDYLVWLEGMGYRLAVIAQQGAPVAGDADAVLRSYAASGVDHIDILAECPT